MVPEEKKVNRLVMLGLIHRDDAGPPRLQRWLEAVEPEVLTLEFTRHGLEFRKTFSALGDKASFLRLPFEYEVAEVFARRRAIPLYLVDMEVFSHLKLTEVAPSADLPRGSAILPEDAAPAFTERILADLFFRRKIAMAPYTEEMLIRDRHMARKIEILMRHHGGKRFLHICGWRHLLDPYRLYAHLEPQKVFIHDEALRV